MRPSLSSRAYVERVGCGLRTRLRKPGICDKHVIGVFGTSGRYFSIVIRNLSCTTEAAIFTAYGD